MEYELNGCQLFNLDFNDSAYEQTQPIPEQELNYFCTDYTFGDLHLHYVHVGRPLHEMFMNRDRSTPRDQFLPQHYFNATCGLVFREAKVDEAEIYRYFDSLGGKTFFGYSYHDPRLANGYFKLGQLEGYETLEAREQLRSRLAGAEIVDWRAL